MYKLKIVTLSRLGEHEGLYTRKAVEDMTHKVSLLKGTAFYRKRLRSCQAYTYMIDDYVILVSYNTIVAYIDIKKKVCYDVLRIVYGYTATSAHHISKFISDYSNYIETVVRYYE